MDGRVRAVLARAVLARSRRVRFGIDAEDVSAPGYRQRRRARHRQRSPRKDPTDDDAGDAGRVYQARVRRVGGAGALGATRAVGLSNAARGAGAGSTVYEQIAREGPNDAVAPNARLLRDRVEVRRGGARQVHRGAVARVPADAVVATQRVQQPPSRRSRRDALAATASLTWNGGNLIGNSATTGGGFYVEKSPLTANNLYACQNSATADGGGVYAASGALLLISNTANTSSSSSAPGQKVATKLKQKQNKTETKIFKKNKMKMTQKQLLQELGLQQLPLVHTSGWRTSEILRTTPVAQNE